MEMEEKEFIKITDLKPHKPGNNDNNDLNNNIGNIDIYQVQALSNNSYASIIKVGIMANTYDVLIKKFTIFDQFNCYIISKLYSIQHIKELSKQKLIPMIKLNICKENNQIAYLTYNFNSKTDITIAKLEGNFTITIHYNNKYMILETLDAHLGNDNMMLKLTEWLLSDIVQNIIHT